MKDASATFKTLLRQGYSELARIWKITLTNGKVYTFTDGSSPVYFNNELYVCNPGIDISAIRDSTENGYSDASIYVSLDEDYISEEAIRYRELYQAIFTIRLVHCDRLDAGSMLVFAGTIVDSNLDNIGRAELSVKGGLGSAFGFTVGEVYSERCRNVFGDSRCKVDTKKFEVPFIVTGVNEITGEFYMSITADEQSENTDMGTVYEESFTRNGRYEFTVPAGVTNLSVVIGGASGGGGDPLGGNGNSGDDSWFGGPGGGFPRAFGGGGGVINQTSVPNGGGRDGTVFVGAGAAGGQGIYKGGAGGRVIRDYQIGIGKDFQNGQKIPLEVGFFGGIGGLAPNRPATAGFDGFVIVYTRSVVTTTDEGFNFGRIEWVTGANAPRLHNIKSIVKGLVTLAYNLYRPIKVGDKGIFTPGCSNYRSMCMNKYNNLKNLRAEPDVPNIQPEPPKQSETVPPESTIPSNFRPAGGG